MIYAVRLQPQVADTDMFGYVDYLAFSRWFDRARTTFYQELFPKFDLKPHGLAVVKVEVEYCANVAVDDVVEIKTWISRIGAKSFDASQELVRKTHDGEEVCAKCRSIFSTLNFDRHKSEPLSEHFLAVLRKYADARALDFSNATIERCDSAEQ